MAEKLSANEIVKALICCCDDSDGVAKCAICPFNIDDYQDFCVDELLEQALALINHQQAEIESLHSRIFALNHTNKILMDSQEVYWRNKVNEFTERLKAELRNVPRVEVGGYVYYLIGEGAIDNIAKEMAGDSDA